ncbi:Fanconi anemia group D2-like protein, partial [Armadillidium nasatum]
CSRPVGLSSGISSRRTKSKSKENNEDYELLLFSTIKTSSLLHKSLGTAWLKAVCDVNERNSIKHFDFLILLVLYQYVPSRRKGIESSIRNMVRLEIFTPPYIESVFRNHSL